VNTTRALFGTLGVVLTAGVALLVVDPGLAGVVPVQAAVAALGNDYFFVAVFGLVAFALVLAVFGGRLRSGLNQTTPPEPETVQPSPHFGADFDDTLANEVGLRASLFTDRRERVRERLRDDAIQAEMAATGCRRATARTRVETGDWTADPDASAFLSDDAAPPVESRIRAGLRGNTWFQRGARRTADTVARKWGSTA
jgi:hypothetical protein